jgi:hypothetical protein
VWVVLDEGMATLWRVNGESLVVIDEKKFCCERLGRSKLLVQSLGDTT